MTKPTREQIIKIASRYYSIPMMTRAILDDRKTVTRRVIKIDDVPENWNISIAGTSIVRTEPMMLAATLCSRRHSVVRKRGTTTKLVLLL